LHEAIATHNKPIIEALITKGADVNFIYSGSTPLHAAVKEGLEESVGLLLKNGARVNVTDTEGKIPLHLACNNTNTGVIDLLLKADADIDATDEVCFFLHHLTSFRSLKILLHVKLSGLF
jgi:ankyrin repeat protein